MVTMQQQISQLERHLPAQMFFSEQDIAYQATPEIYLECDETMLKMYGFYGKLSVDIECSLQGLENLQNLNNALQEKSQKPTPFPWHIQQKSLALYMQNAQDLLVESYILTTAEHVLLNLAKQGVLQFQQKRAEITQIEADFF